MTKIFLALAASLTLGVAPSPVADAAMKGDLVQLRALIAKGSDVNAAQGDGMTALHWAAERGDSAMTALLLRAKASVRSRTRIGDYIPLHIAARNGKAAVVMQLLKAGSDVKALTPSGATPLHLAAASGNPVVVKALVDHGADVNAREREWGQTPLVFAASYGRAEAIKVLLEAGADPSLQTRTISLTEQEAAEQAATRKRNAVLVSFEPERHRDTAKAATVVEEGGVTVGVAPADSARPERPKEPTPIGPFTPSQIQEAIDSGRAVLLGSGSGKGPVTEVVDTINGGVAGYVASVGGVGGLTALHHAVRQGHVEATMALLRGGADINARTGVDSTTPLLLAAINGHFDLATELLKLGGDPNIANTYGLAPLYAVINTEWRPRSRFPQPHAAEFQRTTHLQLMEALLKAGAQPNVRIRKHFWYFAYNNCGNGNCGLENLEGTTPFWRAVYSVDLDAMKMLVKYGADVKLPSERAPEPPAPPGVERRGRRQRTPPVAATPEIDSAGKAAPAGVGVYPIHAAAGVGYGNGFAGNSHRHAPDGWMPAMRYLVEELGANVNERDAGGYTPLHHAAARGDNEMILYLVSKGADPKAVSRDFRTTIDMANGPVQRLRPFAETIALLEKLGAKNSHRCVSC